MCNCNWCKLIGPGRVYAPADPDPSYDIPLTDEMKESLNELMEMVYGKGYNQKEQESKDKE